MSATKRRGQSRPVLADETNVLITAIRADGRHDHVTVEPTGASSTSMSTRNPSSVSSHCPARRMVSAFITTAGAGNPRPSLATSAASQVFSPPSSGPTWTLTTFHPRRADRTTSLMTLAAAGRSQPTPLAANQTGGSCRAARCYHPASVCPGRAEKAKFQKGGCASTA